MENQFLAQYDLNKQTKDCPKCEKNRLLKFFGVRIMREPGTGNPLKARFQSYCVDCRSLKPGQKPGTAKAKKAKAGGKKKVRAQVKAGKAKVVPEVEAAPVILGGDAVAAPPAIEIPVVAAEPEAPVVTEVADLPAPAPVEVFTPEEVVAEATPFEPEALVGLVEVAPVLTESAPVETLEVVG
jgi:hypothetical protein